MRGANEKKIVISQEIKFHQKYSLPDIWTTFVVNPLRVLVRS